MKETKQEDLMKTVFDALPSMVFVVDRDVRIQEYNEAAADLLMADRKTILKKRTGEVIHCVHSQEVPEGCGNAPFCKKCIIRNAVREAFHGQRIVRRRSKFELSRAGNKMIIYALITASPFRFQDKTRVLLILEDISEIAELQRLIPICAECKKVRDENESWMKIETYFKDTWDVDFTHGICPDCFKAEIVKLEALTLGAAGTPALISE